MTQKNQRLDARRDANEPEIVKALEAKDYLVHRIGNPGDLLVWNHDNRTWVVLEVKTPEGRLTPRQKTYREKHPDVDIPIVETKEEAIRAVYMR